MAGWADIALELGTSLLGGYIDYKGQKDAAESQQQGTAEQIRIEGLNRQFQKEEFDKQIARQQPFVDVGNLALPQFIEALSNRPSAAGLPATQIQGGMISDFLGSQAPGFVKERSLANLGAIEAEKNKGRLSDLINIGLGGVGSSAGTGVNLGTTLGQSLMTSGNLQAQGLQAAAANRENRQNQLFQGLSGLPALAYTAYKNQPQGNVYTGAGRGFTNQNPLGLTPGQGL